MGLIFVDIDTQHDFMDVDGALYVPGAEDLIPAIEKLYALATAKRIPIIATMDCHAEDDPEFAEYGFPPHCVRGTYGWEKIDATVTDDSVVIPREGGALDRLPSQVIIEKVAFSVFTNPHAERVILETVPRLAGIEPADVEYVVFGVATDYCVKAAAIGLAERGASVYVVTDGIAAVDVETGEEALRAMECAGVKPVMLEEVESMAQ